MTGGFIKGRLWIGLWALCGAAAHAAPVPEGELVTRSGTAMGTAVQVRVYSDGRRDEAEIAQVIEHAFGEIRRLEGLMTTWREDSDISRVNAQAGQGAVRVSREVFAVVERAQGYARLSGGAFDISFDALHGLWKFDDDLTPRLPDPRELKRRLPLIDWRKIVLDRKAQTVQLLAPGMRLNLGGIGKGFAVDAAAAVLRQGGFPDHIVQAGGDLMLSGSKGGKPWMAGVRDPRGPVGEFFAVCPVMDHAFSTAGDYERSFILRGKRYHHIIDPRTGYPATRARSVTVFARDATTADGLDDAILILGPQAGFKLLEGLPDTGAIVVDDKNRVHISSRLRGKIEIVHPPTPGL